MHGYIVVFIWNPFVPGIAERWIINIQDFYINAPQHLQACTYTHARAHTHAHILDAAAENAAFHICRSHTAVLLFLRSPSQSCHRSDRKRRRGVSIHVYYLGIIISIHFISNSIVFLSQFCAEYSKRNRQLFRKNKKRDWTWLQEGKSYSKEEY